jgi:glycosyltransferase involved in cell wall biosynthesis
MKKTTILTLSDHPISPSGVGTQTRYMIEHLLKTGKYKVISLGGAIKHTDYRPQTIEEFGEDWTIYPVDGYGNADMVRSIMQTEKPDVVWFMTDPRFWPWLWAIDNEIRCRAPMVYYHVWDNYPYPKFNKPFYDSNDVIVTISKVTDDIVKTVSPDVECIYLPHAVDENVFKPMPAIEIENYRNSQPQLQIGDENKVLFFWNNRNARRKQSGTLIWWFKEFLDEVGHENATLLMHTDPKDPHGQDLEHIIHELNLTDGQVLLSTEKYPAETLAQIYNAADCVVNISDAEGFGLSTLEALSCGTPIIVTMTGGLQQQVTDGTNWFGVGIEPSSKAIIGSQEVPYIYEDRISKEDFVSALKKIYNMSKEERTKLGQLGREHVMKDYSFSKYCNSWDATLQYIVKNYGSWEERKNYNTWTFKEVA